MAESNGPDQVTYSMPMVTFKDRNLQEVLFLDFFPSEVIERRGETECRDEFISLLEHMSHPPVYSILRVNTVQHEVQDTLTEIQNKLQETEPDRRYMVRRHPKLFDVLIIETISEPARTLQPCSTNEVIIDPICGAAVLRGANIFGRGVIGLSSGTGQGDQVSVFVDLDGKCRRGLKITYTGKKTLIGNGILKTSRNELFEGHQNASGVAVEITETFVGNPSLNDLLPKKVFDQNLPSIVCSHVLDPQPNETILDMCAAPGGKTTHIAALMNDTGLVIGLEKARNKVKKIKKNARKLSLTSVKAFHKDAKNAVTPGGPDPDAKQKPPYRSGSFDRVLLDAPCSGTGQRAQIYCVNTVRYVKTFPNFQKSLFYTAVEAVKPGGTIVYSTCSLTTSENEAIVSWALQKFPELELGVQTPFLGSPGVQCHGLTEDQAGKLQRFWPSSRLAGDENADYNKDTIGFFIAKFIKKVTIKCL